MKKLRTRTNNPLAKRARKGFRGFPVATIAFYGPDDQRASKVAVGIVTREDVEPEVLERWYSEDEDLRSDLETVLQIQALIKEHSVVSVVLIVPKGSQRAQHEIEEDKHQLSHDRDRVNPDIFECCELPQPNLPKPNRCRLSSAE